MAARPAGGAESLRYRGRRITARRRFKRREDGNQMFVAMVIGSAIINAQLLEPRSGSRITRVQLKRPF